MLTLYYSKGSCALLPHIALHETQLAHQLEHVSLRTHTLADGRDYYQLNPTGQVPLLTLADGTQLTECSIIAQYLADLAPASGLLETAHVAARYLTLARMNFIATELHKGHGPLFTPNMPAPAQEMARNRLLQRYELLNTQLTTQPYLMGANYSLPDIYLYVVMTWASMVQLDLSHFAALQKWFQMVQSRPAVSAARRAQGLDQ